MSPSEYTYDGFGRRISKTVSRTDETANTWYYAYDGGGNQLALYKKVDIDASSFKYVIEEQMVYGASREGVYKNGNETWNAQKNSVSYLDKNNLFFEINDHLGNVRAVVSGTKVQTTEGQKTFFISGYEGNDFNNYDSFKDYTVYLDNTKKYSGQYALKLPTNSIWGPPIYKIKVNPGDLVDLNAYTYFEGGTGTTGGSYILKVRDEVSGQEINYWTKDYGNANTIAGSWQEVILNDFVIPAVGGANRVLYLTIKPLVYDFEQITWFDDLKVVVESSTAIQNVMIAQIISLTDYYPFGMAMPGRTYSSPAEKYRYGFNGMEKDDDWYGAGNEYTTEFRQFDPRIGRWMSLDPMASILPDRSPYEFVFNNPISLVDPSGLFPSGGGNPRTGGRKDRKHNKIRKTIKDKPSSGSSSEISGTWDEDTKSFIMATITITGSAITGWQKFSHSRLGQSIINFGAGFGYELATNNSPIGEVPGLNVYNNGWYNTGRKFGNFASQLQGIAEIVVGAIEIGAGAVGTPVSGGATLALSAKGALVYAHGAMVFMNARSNKGEINDVNDNLHSGSSNSGGSPNSGANKKATPDTNPKDFIKQKGNQGYVNKKTGEIYRKSNTSHGNKGNEGKQWKVYPKGTKDFTKQSGNRTTIDGEGNIIGD